MKFLCLLVMAALGFLPAPPVLAVSSVHPSPDDSLNVSLLQDTVRSRSIVLDTLVIRRGRPDLRRGEIATETDTVIVRIDSADLALPAFPDDSLALADLAVHRDSVGIVIPKLSFEGCLDEGDRLRGEYDFTAAIAAYRTAYDRASEDRERKMATRRMVMAQNALNLTEICRTPAVVAKQQFPIRDFFLFYPLPAGSWRMAPNPFDEQASEFVSATYLPKGATSLIFSKADEDGYRNLCYSEGKEKEWALPQLIDEHLFSEGNEIYPLLSADGKTLYFASDGLYGMGGYDLYRSELGDDGLWGEPVNMGFPFSSPGDDFLLMDTPDGKYTIFASNRECDKDSVYLYVLEQSREPALRSIQNPEDLRNLSRLIPTADPTRIDAASAISNEIPDNDNTRLYQDKSTEVSRLRDSVYRREHTLDGLRKALGSASAATRDSLSRRIAEGEEALIPLRSQLAAAQEELQRIEMDFLRDGIHSRVRRTAEREVVGARSGYVFTKNAAGPKLTVRFAEETVPSGPSGADSGTETRPGEGSGANSGPGGTEDIFRISPIGRFASDNTLPSGIIYQIRLLSSGAHVTVEDLEGLSPVYERLTSSLQFTYAVGIFHTYASALARLGKVRRLGFPEATIIAFLDGQPISVSEARAAEAYAASGTRASTPGASDASQ